MSEKHSAIRWGEQKDWHQSSTGLSQAPRPDNPAGVLGRPPELSR